MNTGFDRSQKKRLIVIMPEGVTGRIDLARRIHWMAVRDRCDVLYLALVDQPENMLARSRSMVTLKAMTSHPEYSIDWELVETSCWLTRLKEIVRPGDVIVCQEEQLVKQGTFHTVSLQDFLQETLHNPVQSISGYYQPQSIQVRQWAYSLVFWIGILAILAGFSFLEIRLHLTLQGIEQKILLVLVMLIEIAALWAWNHATGRWNTEKP